MLILKKYFKGGSDILNADEKQGAVESTDKFSETINNEWYNFK